MRAFLFQRSARIFRFYPTEAARRPSNAYGCILPLYFCCAAKALRRPDRLLSDLHRLALRELPPAYALCAHDEKGLCSREKRFALVIKSTYARDEKGC